MVDRVESKEERIEGVVAKENSHESAMAIEAYCSEQVRRKCLSVRLVALVEAMVENRSPAFGKNESWVDYPFGSGRSVDDGCRPLVLHLDT
jgi:hypothetical protein